MTCDEFKAIVRVKQGLNPDDGITLSNAQKAAYLILVESVRPSEAAQMAGISMKAADNARRLYQKAADCIAAGWGKGQRNEA